jgi:AcrR family transcriptional regulator
VKPHAQLHRWRRLRDLRRGAMSSSLREELRAFKRERILEEVLALFWQRGFHGTTLDAVAERLQVTKPFIYQFFRSKEELLLALYERGATQLLDRVAQSLSGEGSPRDRLHAFVHAFALQNIENQAISAVFIQEEKTLPAESLREVRRIQREFDATLTRLIEQGVAAGEFHAPDPRLAALAIAGMVRWIHRWYRAGGRRSGPEIAEEFAAMALRMLGAAEAVGPGA